MLQIWFCNTSLLKQYEGLNIFQRECVTRQKGNCGFKDKLDCFELSLHTFSSTTFYEFPTATLPSEEYVPP